MTQTTQQLFPSFDSGFTFLPTSSSYQSNENTRLHAQMNFLSSPHSIDYSDEAYIKIQAIQDYCSVDYATFCTSMLENSMQSPLLASQQGMNMMPFGNWEADDDAATAENSVFIVGVMNSIFDVFSQFIGTSSSDSPTTIIAIDFVDSGSEGELPQTPCNRNAIPPPPPPPPPVDILPQIDPIFIEPDVQSERLLHENALSDKEQRQFRRPGPFGKPPPHFRPEEHGDEHSSSSSSSNGLHHENHPHPPHPHPHDRHHMERGSHSSKVRGTGGCGLKKKKLSPEELELESELDELEPEIGRAHV